MVQMAAETHSIHHWRYWLEQMPCLGLDPDALSFNAVIDACARAGEVDRAEERKPRGVS